MKNFKFSFILFVSLCATLSISFLFYPAWKENNQKRTENLNSKKNSTVQNSFRNKNEFPNIQRTKLTRIRTEKNRDLSKDIDVAYQIVDELEFSSDQVISERLFFDKIEYLLTLPASRDREFLIERLVEKFSASYFKPPKSTQNILTGIVTVDSLIRKKLSDSDAEQVASTLLEKTAKFIASSESKSEILEALLYSMKSQPTDLFEKLTGYVVSVELVNSPYPEPESLESIKIEKSRKAATRHFLVNFNFAESDPKTIANFASYYLNTDNVENGGKTVAISLFGSTVSSHPELVSQIISDSKPSRKRDEAIEQMIYRMAPYDNEYSQLWLGQIQNFEIRERAKLDVTGDRIRALPALQEKVIPSEDPFR